MWFDWVAAVAILCSGFLVWFCFMSSWSDPDLASRLGLGKPWDCPQGVGKHYRACSHSDLTLDQWKSVDGCLVWILGYGKLMNYSVFLWRGTFKPCINPLLSIYIKIMTRLAFYCQLFRPSITSVAIYPPRHPSLAPLITFPSLKQAITTLSDASNPLSLYYHLWIPSNPVNLGFLARLPN